MKTHPPYAKTASYCAKFFRWLLFAVNLLLLLGLGFRTAQVWVSVPFDFPEALRLNPTEPEFEDPKFAERQMWIALAFQSAVYVTGAFLCYAFLIKTKNVLMNLAAPFFVAFLLLAGESSNFFLPALDKARAIKTCKSIGISWNKKTHTCDLMELEKKRLEKLAAKKKPAAKKKAKRK